MSARIVKKRVLVVKCEGCGQKTACNNYNIREKMCGDCVEKQQKYLYQYSVCWVLLPKDLYDKYLAHHTTKSVNEEIQKAYKKYGTDENNCVGAYAYYPTCGGMMWLIEVCHLDEDEEDEDMDDIFTVYQPVYVKHWNDKSGYKYDMLGLFNQYEREGFMVNFDITEIKSRCCFVWQRFLEMLQ